LQSSDNAYGRLIISKAISGYSRTFNFIKTEAEAKKQLKICAETEAFQISLHEIKRYSALKQKITLLIIFLFTSISCSKKISNIIRIE